MKEVGFQVVRPDGGFENVNVLVADVERLIAELALFGDDASMQRSRKLARDLYDKIEEDELTAVQVSAEHRDDVFMALDRIGMRSGLSDALAELRRVCAPQ